MHISGKKFWKVGAFLVSVPLLGSAFCSIPVALAAPSSDFTPLTVETAQKIADGTARWCGSGKYENLVDRLLAGKPAMDPAADDDGDGVLNRDEIGVSVQGNKVCLQYKSHPKLADTDGDGIIDGKDEHPLRWDVQLRDAIIMQRLAYRDDAFMNKLFDLNYNYGEKDWNKSNETGGAEYAVMRKELAPYWEHVKYFKDDRNGFDAHIFKFSNKFLPFLENGATTFVAIAGTDPGESGDLKSDAALAVSRWPQQGYNAQNLAKQVFDNNYANVYVSGHSLGGFLAQLFAAHSLGKIYQGQSWYSDADGTKRNDLNNQNLRKAFTFNAPQIKCRSNFASRWMCEYNKISTHLTEDGYSEHYVTKNDTITPWTGAFPGAKYIENSDAGHGSSSFFEEKYQNLPGFSIGKRVGYLKNGGYIDPLFDSGYAPNASKGEGVVDPIFVLPTKLVFVDKNNENKQVGLKTLYLTQGEIANLQVDSLIKQDYSEYEDTGSGPLLYGETRIYKVAPKSYKIRYVFVDSADQDKVVDTKEFLVNRGDDFTVPAIPKSADPDYDYIYNKDLPKPDTKNISADQEYKIALQREPKWIITNIDLVEKETEKVLRKYSVTTKPSQKDQPVELVDEQMPAGYQYVPPKPTVRAGVDTKVYIEKITHTLDIKYVHKGVEVGNQKVVLGHGEEPKFNYEIPDGYQLPKDAKLPKVDPLTADKTVQVEVEPITVKPNNHNVEIVFVKASDKTQIIGDSFTMEVPEGKLVPLDKVELPKHPKADQGYKYVIDPGFNNDKPVYGDISMKIPLREASPATSVNDNAFKNKYPVTIKYVFTQGTDKQVIAESSREYTYQEHLQIEVPKSERGTYTIDPKWYEYLVTKAETIEIPLRFTPYVYDVTVQYLFGQNIVKTEKLKVEHGQKTPVTSPDPNKWEIDPSFPPANPEITQSRVLKVPLRVKEPAKPVPSQPVNHQVKVEYYEGDKLIASENQTVAHGSTIIANIPTPPDQNGEPVHGFYRISPEFKFPVVNEDTTVKVPLVLERTKLLIDVVYYDKAQVDKGNKREDAVLDRRLVGLFVGDEFKLPELSSWLVEDYYVDPNYKVPTDVMSMDDIWVPLLKKNPNKPEPPIPTPTPDPQPNPTPSPDDGGNHPDPIPVPSVGVQVVRYGGLDRVETALQAYLANPTKQVFLVGLDAEVDALAGGVLAAQVHGSILFTDKNGLDARVAAALRTQHVEKITIIGGQGSLTAQVLKNSQAIGAQVERIGGADRYETALLIAKKVAQAKGKNLDDLPVVIASGDSFVDSLVASPVAVQKGGYLLLSKNEDLPQTQRSAVENNTAEVLSVGGAASQAVERLRNSGSSVKSFAVATNSAKFVVVAGKDRYETALQVAKQYFPHASVAAVANGEKPVDALVAGAFVGSRQGPVLLSSTQKYLPAVRDYLATRQTVYLFGGLASLHKEMENLR